MKETQHSVKWQQQEQEVWQMSAVHKVSNCKRGVKQLRQLDHTALLAVDFSNTLRLISFGSEATAVLFKSKRDHFKSVGHKANLRQIHVFPEFDQDVLPYLMADDGQIFDVKMK